MAPRLSETYCVQRCPSSLSLVIPVLGEVPSSCSTHCSEQRWSVNSCPPIRRALGSVPPASPRSGLSSSHCRLFSELRQPPNPPLLSSLCAPSSIFKEQRLFSTKLSQGALLYNAVPLAKPGSLHRGSPPVSPGPPAASRPQCPSAPGCPQGPRLCPAPGSCLTLSAGNALSSVQRLQLSCPCLRKVSRPRSPSGHPGLFLPDSTATRH